MDDLHKVIRVASRLEAILEKKYKAEGGGLGIKIRDVENKVPSELAEHIKDIAAVRNLMAHDKIEIDSLAQLGQRQEKRFYESCKFLEEFFDEKLIDAELQEDKREDLQEIINPFIEVHHPVSILKRYLSTPAKRLVWAKGKMADVPAVNEKHIIHPLKFDTAVFVIMDQRKLSLNFPNESFVCADKQPLNVKVVLHAQPFEDNAALINIAVYFKEKFDSLVVEISSLLHKFCKEKNGREISKFEEEISTQIVKTAKNVALKLPFDIQRADVRLHCPFFDERHRDIVGFKEDDEVAKAKEGYNLNRLRARLASQLEEFESEQKKLIATAKNQGEIDKIKIETLQKIDDLCDEAKILFADDPQRAEMIKDIQIEKIRNSQHYDLFVLGKKLRDLFTGR